jgi:hypothetical protein
LARGRPQVDVRDVAMYAGLLSLLPHCLDTEGCMKAFGTKCESRFISVKANLEQGLALLTRSKLTFLPVTRY